MAALRWFPLGWFPLRSVVGSAFALALALTIGACSAPTPASETWNLELDASTFLESGAWARLSGERWTLELASDMANSTRASMTSDDGEATLVDNVSWSPPWLEFRRPRADGSEWFRIRIADGTASGRYARSKEKERPPLTQFDRHVSGWRAEDFPPAQGAHAWRIRLGDGSRGTLRIDRDASGRWIGRLKLVTGPGDDPRGELLEEDVHALRFHRTSLSFKRPNGDVWQLSFTRRTIEGAALRVAGTPLDVRGTRSEILSHGLLAHAGEDAWRSVTRRRVENLLMNGNPQPSSPCRVTLGEIIPPPDEEPATSRDDDPSAWPALYDLRDFELECRIVNPFDGEPVSLPRRIRGWLAVPQGAPPPGGFPPVLALHGHGGNSADLFHGGNPLHYFGDAYARRGFLVVAIDIRHHPDAPVEGELSTVPPIVGNGYATSDWEEDGERVWDAMRAVDWIAERGDVDMSKLVATGISMGAEVTGLLAALDPRVAVAIPAGYAPDLELLDAVGSHGCWKWRHADISEYIDQSDVLSLVAPRLLVVQTGKNDTTYSHLTPPYIHELEVVRRARWAWSQATRGRVQHYVHGGGHEYRFGDRTPRGGPGTGVYATDIAWTDELPEGWQRSATSSWVSPTLFDVIAQNTTSETSAAGTP